MAPDHGPTTSMRDLVASEEGRDRLAADGRLLEALDTLVATPEAQTDPDLQMAIVDLRHRAAAVHRPAGRATWPPEIDDPFPEVVGRPPEIAASELNAGVIGGAILHHGSVIVRGLFDTAQIERTRRSILESSDTHAAGPTAWQGAAYHPFPGVDPQRAALRQMVAEQGGIWLADSPAATAQILGDLDRCGAVAAITDHFGSRPLFSLEKSTMRRNQPEYRFTGWHQDGSFLGAGTRALNVWVTLTSCGGDRPAPGLEVVPARVDEILEADGDTGTASINGYAVHYLARDTPVVRPEFDPGDALLFDERMIHRTFLSETMTQERLAVECWFFDPANRPHEYLALLV